MDAGTMKKYVAEMVGTAVLVIMGCGTAMLVGCDAASGSGYLLTALAFGLSIVAMAYCIGNISGCHINPAVSLAVFLTGGIDKKDFAGYVIAQIIGGFIGTSILAITFAAGGVQDMTGGFGANGLAGVNGHFFAGLIVEIVLTFIFVMTILGVTSVNPARSIAPAIFAAATGNFAPFASLWIFIVGPLVGAFLAAKLYGWMED